MFWKGKVSIFKQLESFLKQSDVSLIEMEIPQISDNLNPGKCRISVSKFQDAPGIAKLLNEYFEESDSRAKVSVTPEWIRQSYLEKEAIWIVAKDTGGTVRGCIASFRITNPYPTSLVLGCGRMYPWGVVDWYCVHPLWRGKGLGTSILETLDFITFKLGRKAHIFLKEGIPLALPHVPIYTTWLKCRKAGNPEVKQMKEDTGLIVYPYNQIERATGLPLVRVEGLQGPLGIKDWESALDTELPECWVFVSGACSVDYKKGWKTDSLVSMYAFRWSPGKWLGSIPSQSII